MMDECFNDIKDFNEEITKVEKSIVKIDDNFDGKIHK